MIRQYFGQMNDAQFSAVTQVNGPLLILAGAGSGKTTVLVNRIANLVKFGNGYRSSFVPETAAEDAVCGEAYLAGKSDFVPNGMFSVSPVKPWNILAITFTNKAANELKERIALRLGEDAQDLWAGTFHSICGKILRRYADLLGYSSHFTIYDTDDQRRLMKNIMKEHEIEEKYLPHKSVLAAISAAKDRLIMPEEMKKDATDTRSQTIAQLYAIYQKHLREADAMDFDDMIVNTVFLLKEHQDVLSYYTEKFRYVMVDEYQDTNIAQYHLVSLLASGRGNLCVVGDDDQSIYRFRGATIENILQFEEQFPDAAVIRLEQNYRSTTTILDAANAVIAHNHNRKGKTLWTDNGTGEKILVYAARDERDEAQFVADTVLEQVRKGAKFSDHAVLYRMNAQSNALESVFVRSGIPYMVYGGFRFYERKEIKDVIAYLQVINNQNDALRIRRIINEPKRGIGETTVNNATQIASELGVPLFEVFSHAEEYAALSRAAAKLQDFCRLIGELAEMAEDLSIADLFSVMLDKSGYRDSLIAMGEEGSDRLQNVEEFLSTIMQYEQEAPEPSLSDFLEQIALVSDIDAMNDSDDRVSLMTVHSAKGLEFRYVFLVGMEDGVFPGNQSIYAGKEEMEEERRLAYVAITRAKKRLFLSHAYTRMLYGSTGRNTPSAFLREIPDELCENTGMKVGFTSFDSFSSGFRAKPSPRPVKAPVSAAPKDNTVYTAGQRVRHKTFGDGMVLSVAPMGGDTLLEIAFDTVGTKKLMAGYAKLTVLS